MIKLVPKKNDQTTVLLEIKNVILNLHDHISVGTNVTQISSSLA